jgi:hypothetical protein
VSVAVEPDDPSDGRACVTANYLYVGVLDGVPHQAEGLWTLEIPDHALGRLLHRSPADPMASVMAAHHAALRLRYADVFQGDRLDGDYSFLVPAGPGAFICTMVHGEDTSQQDGLSVHVRAHTWLSDDMLRDDQTPLDNGLPGDRMGDSWLLPAPLRRIVRTAGGMTGVQVRTAGLPEMLSAPCGRA